MYHMDHFGQTSAHNAVASFVANEVRGLVHDTLNALDDMNRAIEEGKALDQIREQFITLRGVEDAIVDTTAPHGLTKNYPAVLIFAAEPIASETHFQMNHVLITVNKRYGTDIRARAVVR